MSIPIPLQVDVASIPTGAVTLLGSLAPILRAMTADNVSPLAVVQLEAIGRCFPISGPLAHQLPDALKRSRSVRLDRLGTSIGWMAGDTASTLAQTAGGQAGALLTLALVEMFCRNLTGHLLFELSLKILPASHCFTSMSQLSDIAEIVSNKLKPLAFGQHYAYHLTRIRETYLQSDIELEYSTCQSLLDRLSVESIVGLLDAVQQALQDETSMVYIEGFRGLGSIVALLMALCPKDTLLSVENGVIFQGEHQSIVISVIHDQRTTFTLEKVLYRSKTSHHLPVSFRDEHFSSQAGKLSPYDHLTMSMNGGLANLIDQLFITATLRPAKDVLAPLVNLIAAIVFSFSGSDFGQQSLFPRDGFRAFLGHSTRHIVRERLELLFGVEPSMSSFDVLSAYETFRHAVKSILPEGSCQCSQCFTSHSWMHIAVDREYQAFEQKCQARSIWGGLQHLIGYAILLLFIETDMKILPVVQNPRTKIGPHLCRQLVQRLVLRPDGLLECFQESDPNCSGYSIYDFHNDLCLLLGSIEHTAGQGHNVIGMSSGATSIYPMTLEMRAFDHPRRLIYRVLDGQFHDGRSYYKALVEKVKILPRPIAKKPLLPLREAISLNGLGSHSSVTVSLLPYHNSLAVRIMVRVVDRILDLSMHSLHLAYMGTSIASPCGHSPRDPVTANNSSRVITTGVEAPLADDKYVSIVLTHTNPEAQFLCGSEGVRSLHQGDSCLNCAIEEAKEQGFQVLIQS